MVLFFLLFIIVECVANVQMLILLDKLLFPKWILQNFFQMFVELKTTPKKALNNVNKTLYRLLDITQEY